MPTTIALDFDGVLANYTGWKGPNHTGAPTEGALRFVYEMERRGHDVVVHTCREPAVVSAWLAEYGFPDLPIYAHKPIAILYVDDRGHRFNGDWTVVETAVTRALSDIGAMRGEKA